MDKDTDKRKPNKRDEQDSRRQWMALREIERAIELAMNSDVGDRNSHYPYNQGVDRPKAF
jgi:hypothetical protein